MIIHVQHGVHSLYFWCLLGRVAELDAIRGGSTRVHRATLRSPRWRIHRHFGRTQAISGRTQAVAGRAQSVPLRTLGQLPRSC